MAGDRFLFLNGFMASGKSTVGPAVAEALGMEFVDLDVAVERTAGKTVGQIFDDDGEARFRSLETEALADLSRGAAAVVAIGGGALQDESNRTLAEEAGQIITLACSNEEIVRRMLSDGPDLRPFVRRTLDAGRDLAAEISRLLEQRSSAYDPYPVVDSEASPAAVTARKVADVFRARPPTSTGSSFELRFPDGRSTQVDFACSSDAGTWTDAPTSLAIVTDSAVEALHGPPLVRTIQTRGGMATTVILPPGERAKTLRSLEAILSQFMSAGLDRSSMVIGLGGGVVGDLAGLAASVYHRGVQLQLIPTTLLAQVDASIGGKTGVDLAEAKNAVGSFWPAQRVVIDRSFLDTLPEAEARNGMAEVIKVAVIHDPGAVALMSRPDSRNPLVASSPTPDPRLLRRAIRNKLEIVAADPYEKSGVRALLNFGHTIGHAIESLSGYALPHGACVAIGMVVEARLSAQLGMVSRDDVDELVALLKQFALPTRLPDTRLDDLLRVMHHDKKASGGTLRMVMLTGIGSAKLMDVDEQSLQSFLREQPGVVA